MTDTTDVKPKRVKPKSRPERWGSVTCCSSSTKRPELRRSTQPMPSPIDCGEDTMMNPNTKDKP